MNRGTVFIIIENIYLQYFCNLKSFQMREPFHTTVFVDVCKHMEAACFDLWNEKTIEQADSFKPKQKQNIKKSEKEGGTPTKNKGKFKIDATVVFQKITFPTNVHILNKTKVESKHLIDTLF